jgi:hypothetical protein
MDSPSFSDISGDSNVQKTCQTAYREFGGPYSYPTWNAGTIEVRVPRAHHEIELKWLPSTGENSQYPKDEEMPKRSMSPAARKEIT